MSADTATERLDDYASRFDAEWVRLAKDGDVAGAIVEYVRTYDYVSFPELLRRMEPFTDVRGTWALELAPNVILWLGMSEAFVDAFNEAKRRGPLTIAPASTLVYLIDGGFLNLPIAKRPSKRDYKKEHWLPVTLRVDTAGGA